MSGCRSPRAIPWHAARPQIACLSLLTMLALTACANASTPAGAAVSAPPVEATALSASPAARAVGALASEPPLPVDAVNFAARNEATRVAPVAPTGTGPVVVVDPGHGGDESGAAANGIVEKDSNLEMAFRVERLLTQAGFRVLLTRRDEGRAISPDPTGVPGDFSLTRRDLQARIDLANDAGAALFVSIHSNGLGDTSARGVETYYNSARPFVDRNRALAQAIQSAVVGEMARNGTPVVDRGALDDRCLRAFQGQCFPLFVLGPGRVTTRDEVLRRGGTPELLGFAPGQAAVVSRPTAMPGALAELLFTSNSSDAALLRSDSAREAMARGVAEGVRRYFAQYPAAS